MNAKNGHSVMSGNKARPLVLGIVGLALLGVGRPLPLQAAEVAGVASAVPAAIGVAHPAPSAITTGTTLAADPTTGAVTTAPTPKPEEDKTPRERAEERKAQELAIAAQPDYVATALFGVNEITLNYPIFIDPKASNECGLSREALLTVVQRNLRDPSLDVISLDDKRPRKGGRADMTYEIYSTKEQQFCLSWVMVRFTDQIALVLPPTKVPRYLTITFWNRSMLARSVLERHQNVVGDALASMSRQFLRDVRLAEPSAYIRGWSGNKLSEEELKQEKMKKIMQSLDDSVAHRLSNPALGGADNIQIVPPAPAPPPTGQ
jgi:hypothetical protein